MICPKCGKSLPENLNMKITFCPICGDRLFEAGKKYLIEIQCAGQRTGEGTMKMFVDDRQLYELTPGENICILLDAGFHTMKFRHKIRDKVIDVLINSSYVVKAYFNSLSGLIETNIMKVDDSEEGANLDALGSKQLAVPVMETEDGTRAFDVILGEDDPDYEIKVTTGLREGTLRLYSERCEFSIEGVFKKEIINYKEVVEVKKKMGSIDIVCDGNVHKVYSIPKDTYNEVLAYLTNRIREVKGR
ncbi:hypothetical protein D6855_07580 [Butyrivibrio sp. CB08]|uniref:hypothetical protein n=1 Tax=Butyrivibrio sp. CB08 TaxID=2364879 RepID=UPI000EAA859B|nr:hypothetical protein [Butyrivibrio sp. CB08]RKM60560.1 hypothetical protein D6855_07580 [Butyrivibrio sp. CB08]